MGTAEHWPEASASRGRRPVVGPGEDGEGDSATSGESTAAACDWGDSVGGWP